MFWNKNDKPALSPEPTMIRTSLAISLEPRMLFDGAVAATVAEAATAEASATPDADSSFDNQAAAPSSATSDQRQEVVFIDSSVKDNQQLLDSLASGTEVVVLDSSQDGLTQMAQYLNGRSGIDAIHLISHGGEANLLIGSARLNLDNIADAQNQLAAIGSSLTASGDFLIYGCDIAKGENGAAFISQLASLTGADVAASTDWTGDTSKGGDWTLEASTGTIESEVLFADTNYTHILNTLDAGDIVVLGWNAVDDTVTFATLVDIPAGTVIKITDKGWDQATNAFTPSSTGDGVVTWTTSGAISAGNIFRLFLGGSDEPTTLTNVTTGADLTSDISASGFTVSDPMNLAGDSIFIYQDADNNPYFIFGMNNSAGVVDANGWNTSIIAGLRDSMTPNGNGSQNALTNGVNAIGLPGGASQQDNVQYTGATTAADRATWLARITNSANWTGDSSGSTATSVGVSGGSEVNILPPNIAPIISNLNGDSTTFTEGGSAVPLDAGSNATVTDADSADFDGGNVTVAITANGSPGEDVLAIRNEGTGTGQISVSGSTVSYGGTAIGTITSSGTGGAGLVVTLNASANAAAVQALIHNLTYANSNAADPSTAARTVSITVNDGDGGTSTAAAVTVNVTGVNDAPAITATGNNPTYTENGSAADLFSNVSINTVETGQTITGMTLTVTNLADGSNEILRIDGTDILLVDGSGVTTGNGISYSVSLAGSTATITLGSAGGLSAATAQTVVDGMGYRNSSDAPSTATRVITLTSITDSGGTANGGVDTTATSITTSVSVVAVNDAPIVTSSGGASTFTEGGGGTVIDSGLTLSDPDNATLASARITIAGNFQPGDVLSFVNDGSTMGNITASYNAGTGVLTLTSAGATATLAQWQAALRSVTYSNGSDAPSTANRTISFVANDGQEDSTAATKIVSVTAVNDAPQITAPASIGVTEDIPSAITGISFSDVDAGSANVTVTLSIGSGTLSATSGGGVTVGGTASALTLTGSIANINSFIAGSNLSFTTAANATADVPLTVNINDGGNTGNGGAQSANETITLQVAAVNDAPTITAPGFIDITEDLPGALTGISFTDVDAGSGNVTATFSVPSGTLSATSGNGVTVGGTASALTLTGSIADINTFIAASGISFTTASNAIANVTLTVTIDDGGNTGSGGAQTDTTSVTLMVTAVNDAPVNSVPTAQNVDQDSALVFNSGNGNLISISDVDAGSNVVQVTLTATNGLLTLGNTAGLIFTVGSGSNAATMTFYGGIADINNALNGLVFSPTGGYNGPASLQITTNDLGNSGSGGAQTDTDTVSITVNSLIPRVTDVSAGTADGIYKVGDTITITATFSEAVTVDTTGGIPTLLLETGSVDRLATYISGSGGNTLTFIYTVQPGDLSADLNYQSTAALSLNGATIRGITANDAVLTLPSLGDANSLAGNKALVVDGVRPTASILMSDTALAAGETATVTITFSEAVSGLDIADFTVANGTLSGLISTDGGITWTATLTPDVNVEDTSNLITLDNTGYIDVAGNTGTGSTNSINYAIDTLRPTASIVVSDTALSIGETATVTITFSEAVSGLTVSDFTVANGALSGLSSSDGGITWTATLAPDANVEDTSNLITLDNTGVQDTAGNSGAGTTDSNSYAIDTQRPAVVSIVVNDTALVAGETTTVTITFSEAVSGLMVSDFAVDNGALSELASIDGGITWTATLIPTSGVEDTSNLITLDNTGYTDTAGNIGTGSTASNNYAIDTQRPTANIMVNDPTLSVGETSTVTVTFSEVVAGLTVSDFAVANGSLSDLSSSDGGITWTATLTPDANVEDTSNLITLDNTGYIDAAGNTGTGSTDSNAYAIDTLRPTATIVVSDTALSVGETTTVTITFSEAVSGLTIEDFAVANGALSELVSIDGGITWTATLTPDANIEDTSNLIILDNTGYTDAAGNTGSGTTDSNNYAIDTQRPTASIVVSDTALSIGDTATVTITFSEAVTSLDLADFTVANGELSALSSNDGGITWTAVLTPSANVENAATLITLNNAGYTDAAGNTGSGTTDSNSYAIDTQRPTASIVVSDVALAAGETSTVTITFSEAVSGLDIADFTVANGTLSGLTSADGGITWTATLTPDANIEDTSNLIILDNTGVQDAAGNSGTGTTDSNNYAIDTQRPMASIVVSDGTLAAGETATVTITFSEAVTGLTVSDFTVANGTLSGLSSSDGGITWTATLTPDANIEDTSNLITLDNTGYTDAAGNTGSGTTDSNNYAIDTQRPTATIIVSDTALSVGETTTVSITFSEAVSGLTVSDFAVANGTLSGLSSSDGGITWTATLTPDANIEDTSNLITLDNTGYIDAAGNTGTGTTDSNNYAIDTQRPTASIVVSDTALAVGETTTVTITFSEAVSGLDTTDFSVANGSLSGLSSSDGGITWTATLTPDANIEDTSNLITLDNTGVTDLAGNAGSGTTDSNNYAIDTQRPTASIVVSDTALAVGETATVTITFSEAVSGLDIADFTVANGTLSGLTSADGGITWTATLTPDTNIEDTSNLITLDNTGYTDAAGNTGSGTTDSNSYAIDTQRPTASIVVSDTALSVGETSTVTITFSEAVTGLTTADFSVANGSLSGLSSSDGGVTWTATLTPDTNIEDTSNLITLDNTGYTDAAGNTGSGTSDSNHYAIDTQRPTASIVVSDTALAVGETAMVTITFSEAVTGLTTADFSVANGSLSGLFSSDGGITWTATLTPDTNVEDTSNLITLDNTGVQDAAGNSGTGTTDSNSYAIDTQRPAAVSIVVGDLALAAGETTTVTITFSEVVSGLDLADFTVANATLSGLSSSDGGITWTATLTPSANVENAANLIALNNAGYTDVAGNTGSGTTDSNSYAIDTLRPTASIVVSDTALAVGETGTITIIFSEAVTGLDLADFSVANGVLSGLSSSDGGITWTATLTPDANIEDTSNLIILDNTGYTDTAGNTGTGTTDSNNYAIDTQRPTASIVVSDTALLIGDTATVTITFSEAVSGLDVADFTIANGTLSGLTSADGGITWTATLTPNANVEDTANLITLNNAAVQDAAGNSGSGTTDSNSYAIDTLRPTATIEVSDTELSAGETTTVTITFSEAVSGLDMADFIVANGTLSGLTSADGGITWTATLTPDANIEDTSNLITLDNTGVTDLAGNAGSGTTDSNNYVIDTQIPTVSNVSVPLAVHYSAGDTLTFVVNTSEVVIIDGTPRLVLDIGGTMVFADYVAGSGTNALVFQYSVQAGLNDADGIAVNGLEINGGSLHDASGNAMDLTLNNVGDTSGVIVDTTAPSVSAIVTMDPSPTNAHSVRYTVTFSEDVSGVDLSDFGLVTTGNVIGNLGNLVQIDGRTYQVTINDVAGNGTLALALADSGTLITDAAGNVLTSGLIGQSYILAASTGDPEFRSYPPSHNVDTPSVSLQPALPSVPPPTTTSPLLPPPLFEVPTLGSGIPTLGNIFINQNPLAPSYIAQVFASSSDVGGDGSGIGFLGFGGGDGGVFGSSSLSSLFGQDVLQESEQLEVFDGKKWGAGHDGGIFGAPTLGQQLNDLREGEQSQLRELAQALQQIAAAQSPS